MFLFFFFLRLSFVRQLKNRAEKTFFSHAVSEVKPSHSQSHVLILFASNAKLVFKVCVERLNVGRGGGLRVVPETGYPQIGGGASPIT